MLQYVNAVQVNKKGFTDNCQWNSRVINIKKVYFTFSAHSTGTCINKNKPKKSDTKIFLKIVNTQRNTNVYVINNLCETLTSALQLSFKILPSVESVKNINNLSVFFFLVLTYYFFSQMQQDGLIRSSSKQHGELTPLVKYMATVL